MGLMLLAAGLAGGCGLPKDPTISVAEVQTGERAGDLQAVMFVIEASNENSDPVPLTRASYTVQAGGRTVFTADRSPEVSVPGKGTQRFLLPAVVPVGVEGPYEISGGVTYLWPGRIFELLLDSDFKRPTVSFRGDGTAPRPAPVAQPEAAPSN